MKEELPDTIEDVRISLLKSKRKRIYITLISSFPTLILPFGIILISANPNTRAGGYLLLSGMLFFVVSLVQFYRNWYNGDYEMELLNYYKKFRDNIIQPFFDKSPYSLSYNPCVYESSALFDLINSTGLFGKISRVIECATISGIKGTVDFKISQICLYKRSLMFRQKRIGYEDLNRRENVTRQYFFGTYMCFQTKYDLGITIISNKRKLNSTDMGENKYHINKLPSHQFADTTNNFHCYSSTSDSIRPWLTSRRQQAISDMAKIYDDFTLISMGNNVYVFAGKSTHNNTFFYQKSIIYHRWDTPNISVPALSEINTSKIKGAIDEIINFIDQMTSE